MGYAAKLSKIVTLLLDEFHQPLKILRRDRGLPRHNPYLVALRATDKGSVIFIGEIYDPIFGLIGHMNCIPQTALDRLSSANRGGVSLFSGP